MTGVYYNEIDSYASAWLRNLIAAGHIPAGEVDQRDIRDVSAADLRQFDQCHFFAGIGGWPLSLRLAGWPDDRPVWTGSCPCQPFSAAGQRKGTADERHLWPEFFRLIAECRPATVFGEQVASKDGRQWLAGVRTDLEGVAYAVGAADLCSAGVGAPHIRQRLWWVGHTEQRGLQSGHERSAGSNAEVAAAGCESNAWRMADADGGQPRHGGLQPGGQHGQQPQDGRAGRMADVFGAGLERRDQGEVGHERAPAKRSGSIGGLEHAAGEQVGLPRRARESRGTDFWSAYDIVPCADGKARRVEPGTFPLAHGVPARVGKLRAYGNAIVPQVAAEFIRAWQETRA